MQLHRKKNYVLQFKFFKFLFSEHNQTSFP
jgi:hypothetical protein